MQLTHALKRTALLHGERTATLSMVGGRRRSWAQFRERVARLAGSLRSLGLTEGARVAILAQNCDRYLECYYALPWAGYVMVPLNTRLAPPEIAYILNDSGCEVLLVDENFQQLLPGLREEARAVQHFVFIGEGAPPEGVAGYEAMISGAEPVADARKGGEQLAAIFYTGGTTGLPKGVMLTHSNLISSAISMALEEELNADTVYLHTAPTFHVGDGAMTLAVTMTGGSHAVVPRFDPAEVMRAIEEHAVTHCFLVPTMINMIVNHPGLAAADLSSLKRVHYAASPMPVALLAQAMEALPGCTFSQGYGMTETSPVITMLGAPFHTFKGPLAGKIASAGTAAHHAEVRVVDENDGELEPGRVGEILTRGPHVMKGYWNKPEQTAEALRGGWMHTGDLGYLDGDGFLFIVDRLKDMIITGGENVYSAEVENAVYQVPGVAMCAVIGLPDPKWGEAVHAIVVPKEGFTLDEAEIMAHCREQLAGYKCPRTVEIQHEPLPLSGAAKILKHQLRSARMENPPGGKK